MGRRSQWRWPASLPAGTGGQGMQTVESMASHYVCVCVCRLSLCLMSVCLSVFCVSVCLSSVSVCLFVCVSVCV